MCNAVNIAKVAGRVPAAPFMIERLYEGDKLTRRDIAVLFGGNARAFLPRVDGERIVAGCFDPEMNPRVPHEVLVHNSPNAILAAQRFIDQTSAGNASVNERGVASGGNASVNERGDRAPGYESTKSSPPAGGGEPESSRAGWWEDGVVLPSPPGLPIFLRRAPNVWEYIGRYRAVSYTEDPNEVAVRIYEIRPQRYERHVRQYGQMRGILFLEPADWPLEPA